MSKKSLLTILAFAALAIAQAGNSSGASMGAAQSGRTVPIPIPAGTNVQSVGVFYSYLAPYGKWFTLGNYGLVWSPTVAGPNWSPYANGNWVLENNVWTWESYDPWGWATCHYGRWIQDVTFGWVWIPGTVWAPAWVGWLKGGGYVGWAPLPPEAAPVVDIPVSCYTFVQEPYFDTDDTPYVDTDDTPEGRKPKHHKPRRKPQPGENVHPPDGTHLRRWTPDFPIGINRQPAASGVAIETTPESRNKNGPVQPGSTVGTGKARQHNAGTEKTSAPAVSVNPVIPIGVDRGIKSGSDPGKSGGVKLPNEASGGQHQQRAEALSEQEGQQKQAEEAQRRQAEETQRRQEAQRQEAEQRQQQRQAEEAQRRQAEETQRQQQAQRQQTEQQRQEQEQQRQAEQQHQQQEQQRQAEQQRQQQEQQRQAEQQRQQQEQHKQAEEAQRRRP